MNYRAHYERLIERARRRVLHCYSERHHVVPRCIGGGDDTGNIVALTAEEHYVAHQLLVKIHPEHKKLVHAANMMAQRCSGNKVYGWLKRRHALVASLTLTGRKLSPEHAKKVARANRIKNSSPEHAAKVSAGMIGRKHSDHTKLKMSKAATGRVLSDDTKQKLSLLHSGKHLSAEHKEKIGASCRGKKFGPMPQERREKISIALRKLAMGKRLSAGRIWQ